MSKCIKQIRGSLHWFSPFPRTPKNPFPREKKGRPFGHLNSGGIWGKPIHARDAEKRTSGTFKKMKKQKNVFFFFLCCSACFFSLFLWWSSCRLGSCLSCCRVHFCQRATSFYDLSHATAPTGSPVFEMRYCTSNSLTLYLIVAVS